ncbi:MAG: NUDIX hydrolase [Candidatus Gracilibacteria bacterium]|nr:NUDIX hydrolase [Candidatus Gracilibacteria bacterium]MDD3119859.1 NUDIX hydrolase [Candidatus Gracilibacteria bacterium]MDD4530048.1 NUDIX hydrolase [Candidatus Gracilibacteria bacterium]
MRIKSRGVILDDDKIFLVEIAQLGFYCLPGGKMEEGETTKQCIEREIFEELGVKPQVGQLIYIQEFFDEDGKIVIDFWYLITNSEDFKNIDLLKVSHGFEIGKYGFYDLNEVNFIYKPIELKDVLEKIKKGEFSHFNWNC